MVVVGIFSHLTIQFLWLFFSSSLMFFFFYYDIIDSERSIKLHSRMDLFWNIRSNVVCPVHLMSYDITGYVYINFAL